MGGNSFHVLVGGEHHTLQGCSIEKREFMHTSVSFVGRAYNELRCAGVPRDRIVVITQLKDHIDAIIAGEEGKLGDTGIESKHYTSHRQRVQASCERLLSEGGADYDFENVNPLTLWNVLLGKGNGKVVPKNASLIHLAIYSHGNSQPTTHDSPPPVESNEQSREWYFNFPYPCPPDSRDIYQFVAHDRISHPFCNFYITQLRQIFISLFSENPKRPIIGLLNFCRSGGGASFITQKYVFFLKFNFYVLQFESFVIEEDNNLNTIRKHGSDTWPLAMMTSSQLDKDSLVSGLWESWFSELRRLAGSADRNTIRHCWKLCESKYYRDNAFELMNHVKERCYSPDVFRLQFQFEGSSDGSIDPWHLDLQQAVCQEDRFTCLQQLQKDYLSGKSFRIVPKDLYSGDGSAILNSTESVVWTNHSSCPRFSDENSSPFPVSLIAWQGPNEGHVVDLCAETKSAIQNDIACPDIACGNEEMILDIPLSELL